MLNGIDVSSHQGIIDWGKVKVDFAIIRCGYGSDFTKQDDSQFENNVRGCEKYNIPYAVYLYSCAKSLPMISSEVAHVFRVIGNHKPFCIYIDMEDASTSTLGKATLTEFAKTFCKAVTAKGFKAGVYANQNWCNNYLDVKSIRELGYSLWVAKYSDSEPKISTDYDIWQYSSKGSMEGIKSSGLDMNYMYKDIRNIASATKHAPKKSVDEIAKEVMNGKWGNGDERKQKLTAAGYNYTDVQNRVNALSKPSAPAKKTNEQIAREVIQGKWGNNPERKQKLISAGYDYTTIQKLVNKML